MRNATLGYRQSPPRSGLGWAARFRPIVRASALPKIRTAFLDCEIAVLGEYGVSSFADLQDALSRSRAEWLDLSHLRSAAPRRAVPHLPAPD
jgi:ATP-dependent DNA ligase